jgi:hypothetical protein
MPSRQSRKTNFSKLVILIGSYALLGITPTFAVSQISVLNPRSLLEKFYITLKQHDGGRRGGFFIPIIHNGKHHAWWDTGSVLAGSGVGYRHIMHRDWLDQSWFFGVYACYDRLTITPMGIPNSFSILTFNPGFELGCSHWGQLTLNTYFSYISFTSAKHQISHFIKDRYGVSLRLSSTLTYGVNPFICISYSWIEEQNYGECTEHTVGSFAGGVRWTMNAWVDLEIKGIFDERENTPIAFGVQFKFDGLDGRNTCFQNRLQRPPGRYIPSYSKIISVGKKSVLVEG